jgi:hypothetical protein
MSDERPEFIQGIVFRCPGCGLEIGYEQRVALALSQTDNLLISCTMCHGIFGSKQWAHGNGYQDTTDRWKRRGLNRPYR